MILKSSFFIFIVLLFLQSSITQKAEFVSCGSLLKLLNPKFKIRLHSHEIKYGSGSGQQSVTGTNSAEDANSYWLVTGENGTLCNRGEPVKCGSIINLQHMKTRRYLHSHNFKSPLSGYQEISCFGENGVGDTGDNWEVVCSGKQWRRDEKISFRHRDTGVYLCATEYTYGRPISEQHEIVGGYRINSCASEWTTAEGFYVKSEFLSEFIPTRASHDPSEF